MHSPIPDEPALPAFGGWWSMDLSRFLRALLALDRPISGGFGKPHPDSGAFSHLRSRMGECTIPAFEKPTPPFWWEWWEGRFQRYGGTGWICARMWWRNNQTTVRRIRCLFSIGGIYLNTCLSPTPYFAG